MQFRINADLDLNASELADMVAERLDTIEIVETLVQNIDVSAREIARHLDYSDIAGELDIYDLARKVDTMDVAAEINLIDVASEIDISDLATHIDLDEIAARVKVDGSTELSDVVANQADEIARLNVGLSDLQRTQEAILETLSRMRDGLSLAISNPNELPAQRLEDVPLDVLWEQAHAEVVAQAAVEDALVADVTDNLF